MIETASASLGAGHAGARECEQLCVGDCTTAGCMRIGSNCMIAEYNHMFLDDFSRLTYLVFCVAH